MTADVEELLDQVGLFAGLPAALRAEVAAEAEIRLLPAGEWLFRQGDEARSLFVVSSGRIDLVVEGDAAAHVVGVVGRGAVLGELALITHRTRAASARARRDTVLVAIRQSRFDALLARDAQFSAALLGLVGEKLSHSESLRPVAADRPRVLALRAAGPASRQRLPAVAAALREAASQLVRTALLDDGGEEDARRAAMLDRAERRNDLVLLLCSAADSDWAGFAMRQADRVVLVVDPTDDAQVAAAGADSYDLVLLGSPPTRWHDGRTERVGAGARYLLDRDGTGHVAMARMARRLLGRSTGVVLSGGGARGLAHLGVLRGLTERGVVIDRIGGTSMGAFIGGLYARGLTSVQMQAICQRELVEHNPFRDLAVPRAALTRGRTGRAMLSRVFGATRIEELSLDYFCVSADLVAADVVVHRAGSVGDAVAASMAVPGWIPPIRSGARLLVDGGLLDNLPIDVMAATAEGPVIAVDVMGRFAAARPDGRLPKLLDTLARATTLGSWRWTATQRAAATAVITPELGDLGMTDFNQLADAAAAGYRAALNAAASLPR